MKLRSLAAPLAGLAAVAFCYGMSRFPELSADQRAALAARFRFDKQPLPEVADPPPYRRVYDVHPSLARISAWISSLGAAATLADLDGDGLPNDIVHVDPRTGLVTVAPVPDTGARYAPFALDAAPLPYDAKTMAPMGTLAGDFNEDGRLDLLAYYWGRAPVLFLKRARGGLSGRGDYEAAELAPGGERWYSEGAVQGDLDGDGHVDLVIGNYFQDGAHILDASAGGVEVLHEGKSKALNGGKKHVYLWKSAVAGDAPAVRFEEQQDVFDTDVTHGWTLAIGIADLDGDLLPELYFAHDFGPDRLMHNRSTPGRLQFAVLEGRRGLFTPKSCVINRDSFKGMGCDFADVNGDGMLDIYVSNIATPFGLTESHFLWLSDGKPAEMAAGVAPYDHGAEELGLSRSGWGWESRLDDFDNDGVVEALQACGFIKGKINRWPELQALGTSNDQVVHNPKFWPSFKPGADLSGGDLDAFFVRAADGRYYDVAREVGLDEPMLTKGVATADVDGDGRLDFALANQWEPSFFYRNRSEGANAFLGLHLLRPVAGSASAALAEREGHPGADLDGTPAYGASVRVTLPDGRKLVSWVDGGSGHSGRRAPDVHLGLGPIAAGTRVPVEIRWRDSAGREQQSVLELTPGWHTVLLGEPSTSTPAQGRQATS